MERHCKMAVPYFKVIPFTQALIIRYFLFYNDIIDLKLMGGNGSLSNYKVLQKCNTKMKLFLIHKSNNRDRLSKYYYSVRCTAGVHSKYTAFSSFH